MAVDDVALLGVSIAAEDMPTYTCASGFSLDYVSGIAGQDSCVDIPLSMNTEGRTAVDDWEGTIKQLGIPTSDFDEGLNKLGDDQMDLESVRNMVLTLLRSQ